jgi:hypothetical protein
MNLVFVSMFYGFGMPIFFTLTLISFIVSYFVDKVVVALYYRKPPMYDDTLNINTVYFLKWGGFFYIAIGFWNLTNLQMFKNVVLPLKYQEDLDMYGHTIISTLEGNWLVVFICALTFFIMLIGYELYDNFTSWFLLSSRIQADLDDVEGLPEFPTCLNHTQLENWILEEELCRSQFGYKKMFDETLEDFKNA